MFGAIGRLFRTFGYLITGRIDRARKVWSTKPEVIGATYDQVVREKRTRLNTYKDAVASMIAIEERKKVKLGDLSQEVSKLEKLREGALARAKQIVEQVGGDPEKLKANTEYVKCQAAFADFSSTLKEKQERVVELEADIKGVSTNIAQHKVQIEGLLRDLEKIKQEKHETIADVISAQEEQKIADMFSGISEDKTAQELQELREMRTTVRAGARVSRELAGMDATKSENEFLDYATKTSSNNEFEALLGLTKKDAPEATPSEPTKIPE